LVNVGGLTKKSLWAGYKKRVRRDVRKAEKSGVSLGEMKDAGQADQIFEIYLETMKRNHAVLDWNRRIIRISLEELFPQEYGKGYLAKQ
jgi:lipid II:glycine glycyltransferase (peptidoglycan interpeptide bridge formation enzyme)